MTLRYRTTRADDADVRQRLRVIAQERRRFGYRPLMFSSGGRDIGSTTRSSSDSIGKRT
jgi:hypothetical protein